LTLDTFRTTGKLLYTLADVQRIFSAGEIAKGQAYFRDGLVLAVEIGADGTVLRGQVQGTLRRPYTATVHIQPQGGYGRSRYGTGTLLAGSCSCPVGYNCKHTVALLLAALTQYQAAPAKREESPEAPLAAWLTTLDQATAASEQDSYPDTVRRRVLYVLNVEPVAKYGNCLTVEAMSVQLLRNGGVSSKASTVSAGNMVNTGFQPAYLQQSDLFVLRSLWAQYGPYFAETKYPLVGDTGQDLLERIHSAHRKGALAASRRFGFGFRASSFRPANLGHRQRRHAAPDVRAERSRGCHAATGSTLVPGHPDRCLWANRNRSLPAPGGGPGQRAAGASGSG